MTAVPEIALPLPPLSVEGVTEPKTIGVVTETAYVAPPFAMLPIKPPVPLPLTVAGRVTKPLPLAGPAMTTRRPVQAGKAVVVPPAVRRLPRGRPLPIRREARVERLPPDRQSLLVQLRNGFAGREGGVYTGAGAGGGGGVYSGAGGGGGGGVYTGSGAGGGAGAATTGAGV